MDLCQKHAIAIVLDLPTVAFGCQLIYYLEIYLYRTW